jgi:acyl carrier protein
MLGDGRIPSREEPAAPGLQQERNEMSDITRDIKEFVVSNFLYGQDGHNLAADQSFLENGIIDSTGVLELVAFLEQRFGISIADRELLPENLDSLQNASAFVSRKLAVQGAQIAG